MTNNCPTEQQLSAYHDGELTGDERAGIASDLGSDLASHLASHLAWCQTCTLRLQQLRQMSASFGALPADGLSQIAWHRLHAKLDEVMERGLIRWAWEVSAIAAAILVVSSVWLTRLSDKHDRHGVGTSVAAAATAIVPPWVGAQAATDPAQVEAPSPAAMWYLADARNSSEVAP
jgi:anti-sigma factor RsiW